MCLEWNSLGVDGGKFVHLAEGLAANSSLEVLDLRNNQLSHDSSSQLATALTRNTTLKTLGKSSHRSHQEHHAQVFRLV